MTVYVDLVMALNFAVDMLLLLAANRLCGYPVSFKRVLLAALLGSVHSGFCVLRGFSFLGNFLWRSLVLVAMSMIAFGLRKSALRRAVIFALLQLALSGVAFGSGNSNVLCLPAVAAGLLLMCLFAFRGAAGAESYVPVELHYNGKRICLTALRDTGNTLRDPVTGRPVLVVGADTARMLTGLSEQQLRCPVESVGALPGLRLIPYRAVGNDSGLLLALKLKNVKIGPWRGSSLVAFAPEGLGMQSEYQALTGGTV